MGYRSGKYSFRECKRGTDARQIIVVPVESVILALRNVCDSLFIFLLVKLIKFFSIILYIATSYGETINGLNTTTDARGHAVDC